MIHWSTPTQSKETKKQSKVCTQGDPAVSLSKLSSCMEFVQYKSPGCLIVQLTQMLDKVYNFRFLGMRKVKTYAMICLSFRSMYLCQFENYFRKTISFIF